MNLYHVDREYNSRELPNCSITEKEGGTIQVVYIHSHPKSLNNIDHLSCEKSQKLLNKILQDLTYFKQLLESPNDTLRNSVKMDIIDDFELGKILYSKYLDLIRKSGLKSQFEKAPDGVFEEIDALLKKTSIPTPTNVDGVTPTHTLDDKNEGERVSNSWDFDYRFDMPNLPGGKRGRTRTRPVITFFPTTVKSNVEEEAQKLPTPSPTPPQIAPELMATFHAQELTTAQKSPEQFFSIPQAHTRIIPEEKSSLVPTSFQPRYYPLKFPPVTLSPQEPILPGIFPSTFQPASTQQQLPLILPPPKGAFTLILRPISSSILSQNQNPPSATLLPIVPQTLSQTAFRVLRIGFKPSSILFTK